MESGRENVRNDTLRATMDFGKNILDETEEKLIATANHKIRTRENTKEKKAQRETDGWMEGEDEVLTKHGLREEYKLTIGSDMWSNSGLGDGKPLYSR